MVAYELPYIDYCEIDQVADGPIIRKKELIVQADTIEEAEKIFTEKWKNLTEGKS